MAIVYLGIAWFAGIWLAATWPQLPWFVWLVGMLGGVVLALWARRHDVRLGLAVACLAAAAAGGGRYSLSVPTIDEAHVAYYNDAQEVTLTGLVVDEPDVRDRGVNLRVQVETLAVGDEAPRPVTGLVLVQAPRFPVLNYGTRFEATGRLETPPEDEQFSYRAYLARQDIYSLMTWPRLTVLAEGEGSPLYHAIYAFKGRAQDTINQLIPEPQAALLSGILLGNDNGLPPELVQDFRNTGMTHIIAISGFNIAILAGILVGLSDPLFGRRGAVVVTLLGLTLYTLLVGADASVVRAAIMGGIYLVAARYLGRPNFAFASLFLAGILMTILRPQTLWDVGFQLSFMATLGLMLYGTPFTRWTEARLERLVGRDLTRRMMGLLSEAVLITLAAQLLTLPLMFYYFQQFSLISFLANILILPAQPGVMIWGGLATLLGMLFLPVGQLFGWLVWLFLTYTIVLVRALAQVPFAVIPVSLSPAGLLTLYTLILGVTWLAGQKPAVRQMISGRVRQNLTQRSILLFSLVAALLVWQWANTQPDGQLHVAFLDVGQGDATFIQTPSGHQLLIDGGLNPTVLNDQLGRQMPFWDKHIDLVVATHPDADHVSGLPGVFDRYHVDLLITDGELAEASPIYSVVLQSADQHGATIHRAQAGEVIDFGDGVVLEVLHPGDTLDLEDRNENSVVLRLVYGQFTMLLTGDAGEAAEEDVLDTGRDVQSLVFKAGHHGSRTSSNEFFLAAVQPQIMVISAGKDNRYGHPHAEVLQRAADIGAVVLRTDEMGTIELVTDGQQMWWQARP